MLGCDSGLTSSQSAFDHIQPLQPDDKLPSYAGAARWGLKLSTVTHNARRLERYLVGQTITTPKTTREALVDTRFQRFGGDQGEWVENSWHTDVSKNHGAEEPIVADSLPGKRPAHP